jgi:hypothetical protein
MAGIGLGRVTAVQCRPHAKHVIGQCVGGNDKARYGQYSFAPILDPRSTDIPPGTWW